MLDTKVLLELKRRDGNTIMLEDNRTAHTARHVESVWEAHNMQHEFLVPYWKDLN